MNIREEKKIINLLLCFYVLNSIYFLYYDYSMLLNLIFIIIEIIFIFKNCTTGILKINKYIIITWIILFIQVILSLIFSRYINNLVLSSMQFIILNLLTIIIIGSMDRNHTDDIMKFFVKYGIILSIYSIVLRVLSNEFVPTQWGIKANSISIIGIKIYQLVYGKPGEYGYSSFTNNPNVFGFVCAVAINIFNSKYYNNKKVNIWNKCIVNLILINGIISSNSRGAIIVMFTMFFTRFMLKNIFTSRSKLYLYKLLELIIVSIVIYISINTNFIKNLITNLSDTNGRTEIWSELINIALNQNIMIGSGYGSISNIFISSGSVATYSAFNTYLSSFVELGIIGFIVFLTIILISIIYVIRNIYILSKYDKISCEKNIVILSFFISIYIISLVENKIMNSSYFNLIWLVLVIQLTNKIRSDQLNIEVNKSNSLDRSISNE